MIFWIVISRWKCHYFQDPTIVHIGFRKNLPVSVLYLFDCQGNLADGREKYGTFICTRFLEHIKIDPDKSITNDVMFDRDSNIQIVGELLKIHYPNISVMHEV